MRSLGTNPRRSIVAVALVILFAPQVSFGGSASVHHHSTNSANNLSAKHVEHQVKKPLNLNNADGNGLKQLPVYSPHDPAIVKGVWHLGEKSSPLSIFSSQPGSLSSKLNDSAIWVDPHHPAADKGIIIIGG